MILILVVALWFYPIIGWLLIRKFKSNTKLQSLLLLVSGLILIVTLAALKYKFSFSFRLLNIIFISNIYFFTCILTFSLIYYRKWYSITLGFILGIITILPGYFISTFGILGIALISGDYEIIKEIRLETGYILRQTLYGNSTSSSSGTEIAITKKVLFLPIEYEIIRKSYDYNLDIPIPLNKRNVKHVVERNEIILIANSNPNDTTIMWADTLKYK